MKGIFKVNLSVVTAQALIDFKTLCDDIYVTNTIDPNAVYVSTTGNNANDGSKENPWLTINYGLLNMNGGQTLYIRGGTYTLTGGSILKGGISNDERTVVSAYPSETVYVSGHFDISGRDYWTVNGFKHHYTTSYYSYGINVTNSKYFTI